MYHLDGVHYILKRPWQAINLLNDYEIFLDGQLLALLRNGRTVDVYLPCGAHELFAKIGCCYSRPLQIEVDPGGGTRFLVRNRVR